MNFAVIKAYQRFYGQEVLNTFTYRYEGNLNLEVFAAAAENNLITPICNIQWTGLYYTKLSVEVPGTTQFYEKVYGGTAFNGGYVGNPMPTFVAHKFTGDRTVSNIRRFQKRIGGVCEEMVQNGGVYMSTMETLLNAARSAIIGQLTAAAIVCYPVVVKRNKVTVNGKTYYVFPPNPISASQYQDVHDVAWGVTVTSQVSRKADVGS